MTRDGAILRDDITGVILCGGEARRMGGVEKPLRMLDDRSLVERVRIGLAPQVSRIVISANRDRESYARWGDTIVADETPGCGPLGGLSSVLSHVTVHEPTPFVFCCPGDAPFLDRLLVARLAETLAYGLADTETDICVPHDGDRVQHLFALLRITEREPLQAYLDAGGRSVHGWLADRRVVTVDSTDLQRSFLNINTEQDLLLVSGRSDRPTSTHHVSEHS